MKGLYIFLLLLLYGFAYMSFNNKLCPQVPSSVKSAAAAVGAKGDCSTALVFKDGDLNLTTTDNFKFERSSFHFQEPSEGLSSILEKVVIYMDAHPDRIIQIKGYFLEEESNETDYASLGIARANSIKSYLMANGVDESQISAIGKLTTSGCYSDNVLNKGITVAFGPMK